MRTYKVRLFRRWPSLSYVWPLAFVVAVTLPTGSYEVLDMFPNGSVVEVCRLSAS